MAKRVGPMEIWPAIDLRGGRCVRLEQGDYERETVFSDDPAEMARRWVQQGAERLHLVDLDGARQGRIVNRAQIAAIRAAVQVPCQLGGGIRDERTIAELLQLGLDRLVIGTGALKQPEWFRQACRRFPGKLALGIDARQGRVATDGWLQTSRTAATALAASYAGQALAAVIYTDIAKDGMMSGPDLDALERMCEATDAPVIASGGITTVRDVQQLARGGLAGCIIGRALYEGKLTLAEAISAASRADQ